MSIFAEISAFAHTLVEIIPEEDVDAALAEIEKDITENQVVTEDQRKCAVALCAWIRSERYTEMR